MATRTKSKSQPTRRYHPPRLVNRPTTNRTNEAAVVRNQLQELTSNMSTPRVRREILEGRNYTVVPMVMITEGVHKGSNGPLYYPAAELGKTPEVWNHKPVVVYHPEDNGKSISACQPAVISRQKVGIIMNTRYVPSRKGLPGRLKAEAWLEDDRLKLVDKRVANAVQKKLVMEVSTGLFTDNQVATGTFNKKGYQFIARNYRPDHLAILPDQEGACSIKDGGGLMRNAASHGEIRDQLQTAISKKFKRPDPLKPDAYTPTPWVRDVYDGFCIYSHQDKTYHHKYDFDADAGKVSLKGSPSVVTSKQTYQTADGTVLNTGAPIMDPEDIIDALVSNASSPFDEGDRDYLSELSPGKLKALAVNAGVKVAAGDTVDDGHDDDASDQVKDGKGQIAPKKMGSKSGSTKNKGRDDDGETPDADEEEDYVGPKRGKKAMAKNRATTNAVGPTLEDFKASLGLEGVDTNQFREVVVNGIRAHVGQKAGFIKKILTNNKAAGYYTEANLKTRSLSELQTLAAMTSPARPQADLSSMFEESAPNYGGMGDGAFDGLTGNASDDDGDEMEVLAMPTVNFNRKNRIAEVDDGE